MLQTFMTTDWSDDFNNHDQEIALQGLENGEILYFPNLAFSLLADEKKFLSSDYADPHAKNISYHQISKKLWGVQHLTDQEHDQLKLMMDRFSQQAYDFVRILFPRYQSHLIIARTSFRPIQISNRKTSYRKDDKRLHVDAFPSAPNQGKRILRVFCNINPNEDRVWRIGEPFEQVANQFLPGIKKPFPGSAALLRTFKITKSYRTLYDHYMLNIHDRMKANNEYQTKAQQQTIHFRPGTSWIVQTDHVSHAAMQGQHVLEQTFYLPIEAMQEEAKSPLRILEKLLNRTLL